jgi:hypothetical protein
MTHSGFGCGFQPLACDGPFLRPKNSIFDSASRSTLKNFPLVFPNESPCFPSSIKNKQK